MTWPRLISALAIGASSLAVLACSACTPSRPNAIVRRIDHVLVAANDAQALFALLTETLQLPTAWPMATHGAFASGGVAFGNVNVEVIRSPTIGASTRWTGFALEPEPLDASVRELDARGLRRGAPAPFRTSPFTTKWTTVALPDVSSDAAEVFLCAFGSDVREQRARLLDELRSRVGGPLSVVSVREIEYGAVDAVALRARFQVLLDPLQPQSEGLWQLGDGPALRVVPADADGLRGLRIEVESLDRAREAAQAHGLFGEHSPTSLTLSGPLLDGLRLTLVERDPADSR